MSDLAEAVAMRGHHSRLELMAPVATVCALKYGLVQGRQAEDAFVLRGLHPWIDHLSSVLAGADAPCALESRLFVFLSETKALLDWFSTTPKRSLSLGGLRAELLHRLEKLEAAATSLDLIDVLFPKQDPFTMALQEERQRWGGTPLQSFTKRVATHWPRPLPPTDSGSAHFAVPCADR